MADDSIQTDATAALKIIKKEHSPVLSSTNLIDPKVELAEKPCRCLEQNEEIMDKEKLDPELVQTFLREKEKRLTEDFQQRLEKEVTALKERCDFILQNEQVRASYMLREAHRERQEKITALQTQLECKNMAGLMFVMCSERRNSKLEKLRLIEEYTNYIHALQDILTEAQGLILHLSRGYKTAMRVDYEWRDKMRKVLIEFQMFVHDYAGGTPEGNQYFFDVPALLETKSPTVDNPEEDPCEPEEEKENEQETDDSEKPWWESMGSDCHPFLVFGDMAEFKPPQRREVLRTLKATKTAPKKWKEYVFSEMFIKSNCANADVIKDEYPKHLPIAKWECDHNNQSHRGSKQSLASQQATRQSEDIRGNMGSILKIMTSSNAVSQQAETRATLLGARDSMEIASSTKLREKCKGSDHNNVILKINPQRDHRTSFFDDIIDDIDEIQESEDIDEEDSPGEGSTLGSIANDSLQMVHQHKPETDHIINYEKVCPMEKCQRTHVDSFINSLPSYMRCSPFTNFEQNFEDYKVCSPEQIVLLQKRIEAKRRKSEVKPAEESPLGEWTPSIEGVGVQTSELSVSLAPCTCRMSGPSPVSSDGKVYKMEDLIPIKQALDKIHKECLYDNRIEFDRFKVLGQSKTSIENRSRQNHRSKVAEIKEVLRQHPSFLDIFQANTQC